MAAKSEARRKAAGRARAMGRWHGTDAEATREARRDLRAAELQEHIERLVYQAPPLTSEQRARLITLLSPTALPDGGDRP